LQISSSFDFRMNPSPLSGPRSWRIIECYHTVSALIQIRYNMEKANLLVGICSTVRFHPPKLFKSLLFDFNVVCLRCVSYGIGTLTRLGCYGRTNGRDGALSSTGPRCPGLRSESGRTLNMR
jgi:hypothetical protein